MAIRANEELENEHTGLLGSSGSGKTFTMQKILAMRPDANVLIYDHYEVYKGFDYKKTMRELMGDVRAAISLGKKFRFAYSGRDFNAFCRLAWAAADGKKELIVVLEEAGSYLNNSAKESDPWYELMTVGRKYGVKVFVVTQRPQNMNKVVYDLVANLWVGFSDGRSRKYIESDFNCDLSKIEHGSYRYYAKVGGEMVLHDKNDKKI